MMNLIEFNKILSHPEKIEKGQIAELTDLLDVYPYFQVAHFLQLKALKKRHSFKYNDCLKKTAAYTTDRTVLFDNITSEDVDIHPAPADLITTQAASPKMPENDASRSDEKISLEKENADGGDNLEENSSLASMDAADTLPKEVSPENKAVSPEETLGIGKPLNFKHDEAYSFREWLQLSSLKPIDRSTDIDSSKEKTTTAEGKVEKSAVDQLDLIDKFIATKPKINTALYGSYTDIARDSTQENENLMTETLAHVYVEQKKYEKAITAFTILSLKYPEKSSFFALQIEAIKKLQEK